MSYVKVLLLGQDPYHNEHQAHGLSFSVQPGQDIPPSLVNIYKELHDDLGCYIPNNGYLKKWANQGVLLLNTVLTVRAHQANSHQGHGWEQFTDAGCRIIYGIDYTKVHSKICLISYKEDNCIKHISQIGTGNYNEKTSKLYTDLSLMTANEEIASEVSETFNKICMAQVMDKTEHLLVAPKCLQNKILDMIEKEIQYVQKGGEGYIGLKFNSLTDKKLIDKFIEASQAGVKINMIIRGICCLIPGVKGYTENINIQSIVGRYLEHSRIYIFGTPDRDKIFISSADFMTRNTVRRVEVAAPIYDEDIKERIRKMYDIMLNDNVKARVMDYNGEYHKKVTDAKPLNSQEYFFAEAYGELCR